jgi:hypothetical protein
MSRMHISKRASPSMTSLWEDWTCGICGPNLSVFFALVNNRVYRITQFLFQGGHVNNEHTRDLS